MKRRIFVAIPIPDDLRRKITDWQKAHAVLPIRWIKPENLHITVAPPWYATDDELYRTAQIIGSACGNIQQFSAHFIRVLFGPTGRTPRLIWAEGRTPQELERLKNAIQNALFDDEKTGFFKKENRPAMLHLTIARFRPHEVKNRPPLDEAADWQFDATELHLMESVLKRTGAEYTVLQKFQLE